MQQRGLAVARSGRQLLHAPASSSAPSARQRSDRRRGRGCRGRRGSARSSPSMRAAPAVVLVIVAEKVQAAVDDQMAEMIGWRLTLGQRLGAHGLGGERDVAEQRRARPLAPAAPGRGRARAPGRTGRWSRGPARGSSRSAARIAGIVAREHADLGGRAARRSAPPGARVAANGLPTELFGIVHDGLPDRRVDGHGDRTWSVTVHEVGRHPGRPGGGAAPVAMTGGRLFSHGRARGSRRRRPRLRCGRRSGSSRPADGGRCRAR